MLDDSRYRALLARDRRFDGKFFVAVKTTGVYCRPICPARTPGRDRVVFYERAAEAEKAGFRACFRCRPELAPGLAQVDSIPRLVRAAVAKIDAGELDGSSIDDLAHDLGVTGRHLRRAMEAELGISPIEYAQTRRLALAKHLLHDTDLPLAQVAFAAGFQSLRRFNASFRDRFGMPPGDVRRAKGSDTATKAGSITLRLDYRPPLDWEGLLRFLAGRAIPGVEAVVDDSYRRVVSFGDVTGTVSVSHGKGTTLLATLSISLLPRLATIVSRLRRLFDLDADPTRIKQVLRQDPLLRPHVDRAPGLRVPSAFDPFEMAVRAILGQQVSVKGATTLSGRFAKAFGRPLAEADDSLFLVFPTPAEIAKLEPEKIQAIGMPHARAKTILALATALAENTIDLAPSTDPQDAMAALVKLPGIGPWTASYLAMRALGHPDAFPAADLGVMKALGVKSDRLAEERSQTWRPYRAYAVMHLWSSLAAGG